MTQMLKKLSVAWETLKVECNGCKYLECQNYEQTRGGSVFSVDPGIGTLVPVDAGIGTLVPADAGRREDCEVIKTVQIMESPGGPWFLWMLEGKMSMEFQWMVEGKDEYGSQRKFLWGRKLRSRRVDGGLLRNAFVGINQEHLFGEMRQIQWKWRQDAWRQRCLRD